MSKNKNVLLVPDELLRNKIYLIREQKVMLDYDLAELYSIETKALKQAARRNIARFPKDFMFQISDKEFKSLRSQIVTSKKVVVGYVICQWHLQNRALLCFPVY